MMLLGDNNEDAEELAGARTFVAMRAPGVIMTPVGSDATELLASYGTAVVEVDRQLATIPCDAVVIDNEYGARLATQHLIDLGHHRIGFLGIDTDWTSDAGRLRGYKAAVTGRRRTYHPRLVVRVPLHAADVDIRISRLLDLRPTAIFAANNLLAERAWRVLRQRKLRLPDDISLVGFDDVPWMDMVEPGITVVAQPTLEMGRRAAALLIERLQDGTRPPAVEVLRPRLVVRGSTGPPQV
jgi:LacI family transcriptional regulator